VGGGVLVNFWYDEGDWGNSASRWRNCGGFGAAGSHLLLLGGPPSRLGGFHGRSIEGIALDCDFLCSRKGDTVPVFKLDVSPVGGRGSGLGKASLPSTLLEALRAVSIPFVLWDAAEAILKELTAGRLYSLL